jgi:hypothetical protein
VSFVSEHAGYRSTYGWYHTGTGEAEILVANVDTATNPDLADFTATLSLNAVEFQNLGFFLIADGYNQNSDPGEMFANGDGTDLDLEVFETNGVWQVRDTASGLVFEGLGAPAYFTEADKNPADNDHVLEKGDLAVDDVVTHNWEDMPGLGDMDYNDVVFEVSVSRGPNGTTPGDDLLMGAQGNDTLTGGLGEDTFYFKYDFFDQDVITDFELGIDRLLFRNLGGAIDPATPDDFTYMVDNFGGGAEQDIRITFANLGANFANEQVDVLDVGSDIEALKADILIG